MRVLIHGINFYPELTGIGKYSGEMAQWLAAQGHEVRVVTAPPYYPAWAVDAEFKNWWTRHSHPHPNPLSLGKGTQVGGSLTVYRCPLWVPRQPSGLKRMLHLASFAVLSFPVMALQVLWRPQVVWVVEPALFCAPTALAVARLCGAKVWLHVQDFEVDAAFDLGLLRGKRLRALVVGAERWLMRRFDVVSTISQRMHQRLLAKGVDAPKARLAVNWVDMALFALPSPDGVAAYRRELSIPEGAVVALYSGNMGGKQGLEILADVAANWDQQSINLASNQALAPEQQAQATTDAAVVVFVFCGNGAGRADLVTRCLGLANVRFMDLQPTERLPDLLAMADIHLLPQRADAADLVMPSKLTGMLASARPVVVTAHMDTELADIVKNCGLVVPPADPMVFAQAIRTLAADRTLRERFGEAGLIYAHVHLSKEAVLAQFEAELTQP